MAAWFASDRSEHESGEDVVEDQRHDGGYDHRSRRGSPDSLSRGNGIVTFVDGDQAAGDSEHATLDQTFPHVREFNRVAHLRPEAALVDAEELHPYELHAKK